MKNVKPVFQWAEENGDANIWDRVLIKIIPQLLKEKVILTTDIIATSKKIELSDELYDLIKEKVEDLIGSLYKDKSNV